MTTIIAAHFDHIENLQHAADELAARGFGAGEYASYYLNPPGQHGILPVGGDAYSDEGAREAGKGAAAGAALGAAAGVLAGAAAGPVGALAGGGVGAYVGSLAGALRKTHDPHTEAASVEHPAEPPGGPMLAVCVDRDGTEALAYTVLDAHGARAITRSEGDWRDGGWRDFDPRRPVTILKNTPTTVAIPPETPPEEAQ